MLNVSPKTMANAIRTLSMDAVQKANSGYPGAPMGLADVATMLFSKFLKFDPAMPNWPDRKMVRYQFPPDAEFRARLRELANERRRFGYRRLLILLRREGEPSGVTRLRSSTLLSVQHRPRNSYISLFYIRRLSTEG
jgi:Transketolase, thiamine diphosphate binding domain